MTRSRLQQSVQRDVVRLRETTGDMLCLYDGSSPTRRSYRAVLEVSPMNLSLKAEDEQEAIIERFHALITSLSFPVQILVRNQRLDLTPYLRRLLAEPAEGVQRPPAWERLSHGLADLLQKIASERTLIERHSYLIIPASRSIGSTRQLPTPFSFIGRKRRMQRLFETQEQARQELALRVEAVSQQLGACGLTARRLRNADLAALFYRSLTPDRAIAHPLTGDILTAAGRPITVKRRHPLPQEDENGRAIGEPERESDEVSPLDPMLPPVPLPDLLPLVDLLAPECVEVSPDAIRIGEEYACGIAVTACPREVSFDGWLAPLLLHDEVMDLSFQFHPQNNAIMKRQLQRHRAGHASGRRFNQRQGRADDPDALVAEEDLSRLLDDLARHRERLFDLGFYILARADRRETLMERRERIFSVLSIVGLDVGAHPTTFEQAETFQSCLPQARDELMRTMTLDATTLSTMFPFLSNSLSMPGGVPMGITEAHEPVLLNPWHRSLENPHMFIGGVTGSGKSSLGKIFIERDYLLYGSHSSVVDPDLEYDDLAGSLGGVVIRLAPGSLQRLNPFDLLPPGCDFSTYLREASKGDRLAEKIQDLHAMTDIILAEYVAGSLSGGGVLTRREKGLADRGLYETYRRVGITGDPRTHDRKPPLLRDFYDVLKSEVCGPDESDLAGRLSRYVSGSLSSLFSDYTSVDLASHLVVWDIRDMRSELRPLAIYLIADRIWTQALYDSQTPRALYIDEAASLIEHPEGGHFLATLSRRARKRHLRIVTMTQNPEQFVQDPWGSVVAANAAIKVLKTQDATSAAAVAERFRLTKGEQQRLTTLGKHEALVLAGDKRVIITIPTSAPEYDLITTDQTEIAEKMRAVREDANGDGEVSAATAMGQSIAPWDLPQEAGKRTSGADTDVASNGHSGMPHMQETREAEDGRT